MIIIVTTVFFGVLTIWLDIYAMHFICIVEFTQQPFVIGSISLREKCDLKVLKWQSQ